ncbi:MAG: M48 family metallopeptidase [Alistipes sp.]|nr:M48 family metallopeptidase [Alistipes sp.]
MKQVVRHPLVGEVTLSQSRRARRISLSVGASGAVRLSYPCGIARARAWAFLESRIGWIEEARRRIAARLAEQPQQQPRSEEEIRRRREELRRTARERLPARVAELSERTGLRCRSVTIRAARSKWGSCNGRNDLSLSLYLMTLPEHLRDFVILHELCHTVHHDHSPRFHALLDRLLDGREKELQQELRKYRPE